MLVSTREEGAVRDYQGMSPDWEQTVAAFGVVVAEAHGRARVSPCYGELRLGLGSV